MKKHSTVKLIYYTVNDWDAFCVAYYDGEPDLARLNDSTVCDDYMSDDELAESMRSWFLLRLSACDDETLADMVKDPVPGKTYTGLSGEVVEITKVRTITANQGK